MDRVYRCTAVTVGRYTVGAGRPLAPGLTLQLEDVETGVPCYAVFNVDMTRDRTTAAGKAGEPYQNKKQFRVKEGSALWRLWQSSGLTAPNGRMGDLWRAITKLKGKLLIGPPPDNERVPAAALEMFDKQPLVTKKFDKTLTTIGQDFDKDLTIDFDKETLQPAQTLGLQPDSGTGQERCGNKVIREYGSNLIDIYTAENEKKKRRKRTNRTPWPEWFLRQRLHPAVPNRDDIKFLRRYLPRDTSDIRGSGILIAYRYEWAMAGGDQDAGRFRANSWLREKFGEPGALS